MGRLAGRGASAIRRVDVLKGREVMARVVLMASLEARCIVSVGFEG